MRLLLVCLLMGCRTSLPAASLHGRVVVPGESPAGLTVSVAGPQAASTTTDEGGEYRFDHVSLGGYTVSATVRSSRPGRREVTVEADGPTEVPELRFDPTGEMEGRVTRGGAPGGNAGILVTVEGSPTVGVTDDAGHYHLTGVATGRYDLTAQLSGYRAGRATGQTVRWDEITEVPDIELVIGAGHAALRGTALLFGAADHAGTHVVVTGTGLDTLTASDGSWAIDGVPEGTYAVTFDNGFYHETVPAVEALPGSDGFVIDESLYPLPQSPLTLFAAHRFQRTKTNYGVGSFKLSPDGNRLLYHESEDYSLRSLPLDGSPGVTLTAPWYNSFDFYSSVAGFSPDSSLVAFIGNDLEMVPAAGGTPSHIAYGAGSLYFAPAGNLLAWIGLDSDTGVQSLFAAPYPFSLGGAPRELESDAKMSRPVWSSDGSHLIYRTNIDDYWQLGTVRIVASSGGPPVDVAGGAWEATVRSDHRYALVLANVSTYDASATLYSVDLTTTGLAQLGTQVSHYDGVVFAGTSSVVYRQDQTIYSVPITGGTPLALAQGYNLKVSPDGGRVAYGDDCTFYSYPCSLWTVPTAGGTPQMVATGVFDYGFSDDGGQVWYTTERDNMGFGTLWVAAVGGTPRLVDEEVAWGAQFTPDGTRLIYSQEVTNDSHGTLRLSGAAGAPSITLAHDVEIYGWRTTPDGKHLVFAEKPVTGLRSLWVTALDGTQPVAVADNLMEFDLTSQSAVVLRRFGTPAPYRFQDGLYLRLP